MKKIIVSVVIIVVVAIAGFFIFRNFTTLQEQSYKTTEITRGSIEQTISSTGTLNPVSKVTVGTQVSGTIVKVYADYNDVVKKNQIIAEIDRQPLLSKLSQSQAAYLKTEAQFEQAKTEYERNKPLHEKGLISDEEFIGTKTSYLAQKASLDAAKADVETAKTNLAYATIRSPIEGTVIERSVEVGQTVAASLSAPTLFIIAENLHNMEILADVDESDIGKIHTEQEVSFSVPAYPEQTYKGTVSQIRLQPTTTQNVVTYSVVISASNPDGLLLPGMTANVDFIAEKAENVLLIPSAALRFKPSEEVLAKMQKARQMNRPDGNNMNKHEGFRRFDSTGNSTHGSSAQHRSENRGMIWILSDNNEIHPVFVKLGINDGTSVSVTGRNISEGMKVITGVNTKKKDKKGTQSRSLFAPSKSQSRKSSMPPPPPGGF